MSKNSVVQIDNGSIINLSWIMMMTKRHVTTHFDRIPRSRMHAALPPSTHTPSQWQVWCSSIGIGLALPLQHNHEFRILLWIMNKTKYSMWDGQRTKYKTLSHVAPWRKDSRCFLGVYKMNALSEGRDVRMAICLHVSSETSPMIEFSKIINTA
jgi:hypothetical protein